MHILKALKYDKYNFYIKKINILGTHILDFYECISFTTYYFFLSSPFGAVKIIQSFAGGFW